MTNDDVPRGWTSKATNSQVYHTHKECDRFPEHPTRLDDGLWRRGLRKCRTCQRIDGDVLELP